MSWGTLRASGSYSDNVGAIGPHVYITLSASPQVGDILLVGVVCDNTGASTPTVTDIHDTNDRTVFSDFTLLGSYTANPTTSGGATVGYLYGAIVDQTWSSTGVYIDLSTTVNAKAGCAFVYPGGTLTLRRTATTGNGDNPTAASQGAGAIGDLLIYLAGQESNAAPTLDPGGALAVGDLTPQSTWTTGGGAAANIGMFMGTRVDTVGYEVSVASSTVSDGGVIAVGLKPDPNYAQPEEATVLGWINATSTPTTASITLRPNSLVVVSAMATNGTQSATASISSTHSPSLSWTSIDVGFRGTYLFHALTGSNPGAGTITLTGSSADWMIHVLQFANVRTSNTVQGYAETSTTAVDTTSLLHSLTVTPETTDCKYEVCYVESVTGAPTAGSGAYQLPLQNGSASVWLTTGYKQREANANIFLQWPDPSTYAGLAGFVVRGYGTAPGTTPVTQTKASAWAIDAQISATKASAWAILSNLTPVSQTCPSAWRVLQSIEQTKPSAWKINAQVSQTKASAYKINAQLSQTVASAYKINAQLTSTKASAWKIYAQISSTKPAAWRVLQVIERTVNSSYKISQRISQTSSSAWHIKSIISATAQSAWRVTQTIETTRTSAWDVLTIIETTTPSAWDVLLALSKEVPSAWAIDAQITQSAASAWKVFEQLTASVSSAWGIDAQASQTSASAWRVLELIEATKATAWNIASSLTPVTATADSSWDVLQIISQTASSAWNVQELTSVTATADTAWAIDAQLSATASSAWDVLQLVEQTSDSAWKINSVVSSSADSAWDILTLLDASVSSAWAIDAQLTATVDSAWAIQAQLASVTATSSSAWQIFARIEATEDTAWNIFYTVAQAAASAWDVLSIIDATASSAWDVLAIVEASANSAWDVTAVVGTAPVDVAWRVLETVEQVEDAAWRVLSVQEQTKDAAWQVKAQVSAEAPSAWAIDLTLTATADSAWAITGSVTATCDSAWNVDGATLAAPGGLQAIAVSQTQINLSWSAVNGASAYDIERDDVVIVYDHTSTSYPDTGLAVGSTHSYRVRAVA